MARRAAKTKLVCSTRCEDEDEKKKKKKRKRPSSTTLLPLQSQHLHWTLTASVLANAVDTIICLCSVFASLASFFCCSHSKKHSALHVSFSVWEGVCNIVSCASCYLIRGRPVCLQGMARPRLCSAHGERARWIPLGRPQYRSWHNHVQYR
jgi:multidrug transporter EmrE-like cation transporter